MSLSFFTTLDVRTTDMVHMRLCGILHTAKNIKFMKYFHVILQNVVYSLGEILGSHVLWIMDSFIINNPLARDILLIRFPTLANISLVSLSGGPVDKEHRLDFSSSR